MEKDFEIIERYTVSWDDNHGEEFDVNAVADQEELFPAIGSYILSVLENEGFNLDTDYCDGEEEEIANEIGIDVLQDYWYDLAIRLYGYKYAISEVTVMKNNQGEKKWKVEGTLFMDDSDSGLDYNFELNHEPDLVEIDQKICEVKEILTNDELDKLIIKRFSNDYRIKRIAVSD